MAITLLKKPQRVTPAFNQAGFELDSTNKNNEAFRYVVDVYLHGTATKIHETRIPPAITTGYGYFFLEKILQSYLSFTLDVNNTTSKSGVGSYIEVDVKVGEEFVEEWAYDDYEFHSSGDQWNGYTQLRDFNSPTAAHTFQVGDQILVKQDDGGALKPMLEGLFTVVKVPDTLTIVIDINFNDVGSGAAVSGLVRYADNRTSITRDLATQTITGFNGAFDFVGFKNFNYLDYKATNPSTTIEMFTTLPDNFYTTPEAFLFLNFGQYEDPAAYYAAFQNDVGTIYRKQVHGGVQEWIRQFSAGAANLGSGTIVTATTIYYDVWIEDISNVQLTKKYRIYIDRRCKISTIEILFMDRLGSFLTFAFQLREYHSGTIKRETFNKPLSIGYGLQDGGEQVIAVNEKNMIRATTNWLNDEMSQLYKELLTSPQTFIKIGSDWLKCIVREESFEVDRIRNKKMIKKTINIQLSNETNVNA